MRLSQLQAHGAVIVAMMRDLGQTRVEGYDQVAVVAYVETLKERLAAVTAERDALVQLTTPALDPELEGAIAQWDEEARFNDWLDAMPHRREMARQAGLVC